jgi:hypothetical protein
MLGFSGFSSQLVGVVKRFADRQQDFASDVKAEQAMHGIAPTAWQSFARPVKRAVKRSVERTVKRSVRLVGLVVIALLVTNCHQGWCAPGQNLGGKPTAISAAPSNNSGVVSPDNFQLPIRLGYSAASKFPEIIAKLFCYCGCDQANNHDSLLTCFRSDHGADCQICQEEAIVASQLASRACSLKEIQAKIESSFGKKYPFKQPSAALKKYREGLAAKGIQIAIPARQANSSGSQGAAQNLSGHKPGACCADGEGKKKK